MTICLIDSLILKHESTINVDYNDASSIKVSCFTLCNILLHTIFDHTKLLLLHLLAHFIAKLHNDVNFRKIIIINYLSIYFSFPKECFNMYFHVCQCLGYQSEVDAVMCFNNIFSKVLLCMYVIS